MNRNIFIAAFVIALLGSNLVTGQVEKGKFLIGARSDLNAFFKNTKEETTVNGNTTESNGVKITQFGLKPTVGYFIAQGFAGGLFLEFDLTNSKRDEVLEDGSTETMGSSSTTFKIGPFIRYYLDMEKVKPFAHLQLGLGSSNFKYDWIDYDYSDPFDPKFVITEHEYKTSLSTWGIGAGAAFFITPGISLDVMLGFNSDTSKHKMEDSDDQTRLRTGGFGLDVGFSIIIP